MGPRKTIWTRCHKYSKPRINDYIRVVDIPGKILVPEMKTWIEEHKEKTFRVRAISDESAALYGVSFAVTFDLIEVPLCMED